MFNAPAALLVERTLTGTGERPPRAPRVRASSRPAGTRALTTRRWPVGAIRVARAQRT